MAAATTATSVGYWGAPTASVDWCEINYQHTPYVAEFWNTVSNLLFVVLGCYGLARSIREGFEWRFRLQFIASIVTGLGSAMFHGTLQLVHQQCDETPMIWGVLIWVYIMYDKEIVQSGIPEKYAVAAFTLVGAGFATFHAVYQIDIVFQLFFGILCWFCLLRLIGHYATVQDPRARAVARSSMRSVLLGFSLWLVDYHYCGAMRALPINPQGHAWWHIFMGIGTYHGPVFMQYVRAEELKKKAEIIGTGFGLQTIVVHAQDDVEHNETMQKKTR